ncbi:MAG: hypothetical protein RL701_1274 [Pseudomonadota bacterium]
MTSLSGTTAERLQIPDFHKRGRTQRVIVWGLLLTAAAVGAYFYARKGAALIEVYRYVPVSRRDVVRVVESSGHLDASARFEVPAPFAGRLTEILVKPGERVQRGQALARLDDREGVFTIRNAVAAREAAVAHVSDARTVLSSAAEERQRVERLAARGLASTQEVAEAKNAHERAKTSLEAVRAEQTATDARLASARFTHAAGEIAAPISGVVLQAPENIGSAVAPEHALFVLAEPLERMRVDVDVAEGDIGEVRVGQKASFDVLSFPDRMFSATVERIAVEPRREGGVVTYGVRLVADNPDGALLPGMTATVRLEVARALNVLAVRDAALRFTPASAGPAAPRSRLFVQAGVGQVRVVSVKAGLSDGVYTAVEPVNELADGAFVAVGMLSGDRAVGNQPGISLGGK